MNPTQISPSVETHTEEPLWQELTENEQEKICGGGWRERVKWRFVSVVFAPLPTTLWTREAYNHRTREWETQWQRRGL